MRYVAHLIIIIIALDVTAARAQPGPPDRDQNATERRPSLLRVDGKGVGERIADALWKRGVLKIERTLQKTETSEELVSLELNDLKIRSGDMVVFGVVDRRGDAVVGGDATVAFVGGAEAT